MARTVTADGWVKSYNRYGKLVDRKQVKTEPGRAHAAKAYLDFVYYEPSPFANVRRP